MPAATGRPLAWLGLLACLIGGGSIARADVRITECRVDGLPVALKGDSPRDPEMEPLQLSSELRSLEFGFGRDVEAVSTEGPGTGLMLRYKLEGFDDGWRDLPAAMRVVFRYYGPRGFLGSKEHAFTGETPGWRRNEQNPVKDSDFLELERQVVVPKGPADPQWAVSQLRIAFVSGSADSDIGQMGIDAVKVTVKRPGEPQPRVFDLAVKGGFNLRFPGGVPGNWEREGSEGAALAQLKTQVRPARHPMLALIDNDIHRTGTWVIRADHAIPVAPGDVVTVHWRTAYCIGNAGPGKAEYAGLKPGEYWFRVSAFNMKGQPVEGMSLPVVVVGPPPKFYQRADFWFVSATAAVAAAGATAWAIAHRRARRRIERLEREHTLNRERARIARDLHDQIGTGLSEIAMQADWVREQLAAGNVPEGQRRAERIWDSAAGMVQSVDEIVWAVNPANDTLDRFITFVTQRAEQFLDTAELSRRFDVPSEAPPVALSGALRHALFLAVSESLNNVVKHAAAGQVRMEIRAGDGQLRIVVEDDGRGFDVAALKADGVHEGLENMRCRMEQVRGRLRVVSRPGHGTRVEFEVPLGDSQAPPPPGRAG